MEMKGKRANITDWVASRRLPPILNHNSIILPEIMALLLSLDINTR